MKAIYEKPTAEIISFDVDEELMNEYDDPTLGGSLIEGEEPPF